MKLVMITDNYPYTRGEMPFILPELAVTAQQFEIEIICKSSEEQPDFTVPYGIPVRHYRAQVSVADKLKNLLGCLFDPSYYREVFGNKVPGYTFKVKEAEVRNFRLSARKFRDYLRKQGYFKNCSNTVFYSYWYNYAAGALALQKKKMPALKIITRTHGYDLYNERSSCGRQLFKPDMDKQLDAVFFVSQLGREYYLEHFATQSEDHYKMAYLGVPDNGLSPVNKEPQICIFSCSNAIPIKRIDLIIEALALINDFSVLWVHAGGGVQQEELESRAEQQLSKKGNITYEFLGSVNNSIIIEFYKTHAVDLFLTASQTEGGTPVSIMEALSFGVPVIGTAVGGIPEMVHEDTGILLSQNPQPSEIAEAICRYYGFSFEQKHLLKSGARNLWKKSFCDKINHEKFAQELKYVNGEK